MKADLLISLKRTVSHLKREIFIEGLKRKPLVFSFENSKLKGTYTFSLPSGWTCPGACKCLAKADRLTGKLSHGPEQVYRCFAASQEAIYPTVRGIRWHNFNRLKQAGNTASMVKLILESLPVDAQLVRVHVAGDFFSQSYFNAWMEVARQKPGIIFYAYTKSITFWDAWSFNVPENFKLNASMGGRYDNIAREVKFKSVYVVMNEKQAADIGLEVDTDDTHAWKQDNSFALVVHGTQPPGSDASKAWMVQIMEMRKQPKREVKHRPAPTISSLTAQIIRLAARLGAILATPKYVVARI